MELYLKVELKSRDLGNNANCLTEPRNFKLLGIVHELKKIVRLVLFSLVTPLQAAHPSPVTTRYQPGEVRQLNPQIT